jgi:hypothetical protein
VLYLYKSCFLCLDALEVFEKFAVTSACCLLLTARIFGFVITVSSLRNVFGDMHVVVKGACICIKGLIYKVRTVCSFTYNMLLNFNRIISIICNVWRLLVG